MDDRLRQLLNRAAEHYERGEFEDAAPLCAEALAIDDALPNVHHILGVIEHSRGRIAEAARHFEAALRDNPQYTEAALNLAVAYNEMGRYDDARRVYAQASAETRDTHGSLDAFARGKLANMHAAIGDAYAELRVFDEAIVEYRKALLLSPAFADLRTRLGVALRDMGQSELAIVEFEEAKRTNPKYLPARIHLGVTLYSRGRKDDAIAEWRAVLAEDPANKSALAYLRIAGAAG